MFHYIVCIISEIITYLQKKPDVFHQVDSIIGYYIGYSNGKFAIYLFVLDDSFTS